MVPFSLLVACLKLSIIGTLEYKYMSSGKEKLMSIKGIILCFEALK